MAVGKSSLGRVANSNVIGAVSPEVAATVAPEAKAEKEVVKKTAAPKTEKKATVTLGKIYAVGDKLPEYLL